ncbi:MAG: glycosyltransferase family 2 protein [Deltaproteobacteria bacterium]|nr:glycosyltransferase family 2 protein [Deltaproteobacteria bacterium]
MRALAVIPVYNNVATIGDVAERCRERMEPDVLVIDDGSTDGSGDAARRVGVAVVDFPENRGKGAAIVRGLEEAASNGYTHVVIVDADGQHMPEEIPRLTDAAWNQPERIWIGVRRMEGGGVPASSRFGRAMSNFWTTVDSWQRVRDAQSGFRVYPVTETLSLGCKETGFTFEMEVLVRAAWAGMSIGHVDVDVRYPKEGRVSHFDMRRDNWAFSRLSFRMFWGMVARAPRLAGRKLLG